MGDAEMSNNGETMINSDELLAYINQHLFYNDENGNFYWKVPPVNNVKPMSLAGSLSDGYRNIKIMNRTYKAHRLIWLLKTGELPYLDIDHINMKRDDNRFENLRVATMSQNRGNMRKQSNNKSGAKGVCWDKRARKWLVHISTKRLGLFNSISDAKKCYAKAAREHFGEFVRV